MKRSWVSGLTDREAAEMRDMFMAAGAFRHRLQTMLEKKRDEKSRYGRSAERYLEPNWPEQQADINGYQRALDEVISLLTK